MTRTFLSLLFRVVIKVREYLYSVGVLKSYKIDAKIISVGNISVGGAGKTPLVLLLNERLRNRGYITAILEKGYKSGLRCNEIVSAEKGRDTLREDIIGDEPAMIWDQVPMGTRLAVCNDKTKAAISVKKMWPDTNAIIIDDGFQHLKLKRDVDIVLIDASMGIKDKLIPLGRLREPYSSLRRANIVLFTKSDGMMEDEKELLKDKVLAINPDLKVFFSVVKFITSMPIKDKRVFPVSAIYNPTHFHRKIKESGGEFEKHMSFSDHYKFNQSVFNEVVQAASRVGAEYIIVTSKDWGKIKPFIGEHHNIIEAWYEHQINNEGEFLKCCM